MTQKRRAPSAQNGPSRTCQLCKRTYVDETAEIWQRARTRATAAGQTAYGRIGSVDDHIVDVLPINAHVRWWHRRRCFCGCGQWSTHSLVANGLAMSSGCEIQMRRFAKEHRGGTQR
ncbi:hypothetical protein [Nocardia sp. NPDC051463]|uniref:hypothetical protein n=1 Tax=Nocardia sp. NPDC051463 TaxID=3154845 RepID=UPI00344DA55F